MLLAVSLVILAVVVAAGVFIFNRLDAWQITREGYYDQKEKEATEALSKVLEEKRALESRLNEVENQISLAGWRLQNPTPPQSGDAAAVKLPKRILTAEERNERLTRWLLKNGKVTIEQQEKAQRLIGKIGSDIVETCLMLRFIDPETAKQATDSI